MCLPHCGVSLGNCRHLFLSVLTTGDVGRGPLAPRLRLPWIINVSHVESNPGGFLDDFRSSLSFRFGSLADVCVSQEGITWLYVGDVCRIPGLLERAISPDAI
jgi:hypothetical protein